VFSMPSNIYNVLKWVVLILLPGIGTLYIALASLWGFPYPDQIVGSIAAFTAFLGILLGVSSAQFKKEHSSQE
jgi:hypothetical protein